MKILFQCNRICFENFESLVKTFSELGNPFLEKSSDLYKLEGKEVADPESANIENPLSIGLKEYESFLERLIKDSLLWIFTMLSKRTTSSYISRKKKPGLSSVDVKFKKNLKSDCNLFSRFFMSKQAM